LKLGQNESGVWVADNTYGDFGCGLFGNTSFSFTQYKLLNFSSDVVHFNFSTSLRSVKDPLVVASSLTEGILHFDFAQRLKWMIIVAFFSVGGLCTILLLLTTCKCFIERSCLDESSPQNLMGKKEDSFYGLNAHTPSTQTHASVYHHEVSIAPYDDGFSRRRRELQNPPSLKTKKSQQDIYE